MKNVDEYITLSKTERQSHLKLNEQCIERGSSNSFIFKGLLAHFLDTTIPSGKMIQLCHACHNGACCNPSHLYWGTPKENKQDETDNGGKTIWQKMVDKHGLEEARAMQARKSNKNGMGNAGKLKSEQHRLNLSISVKETWNKLKEVKNEQRSDGGMVDTIG